MKNALFWGLTMAAMLGLGCGKKKTTTTPAPTDTPADTTTPAATATFTAPDLSTITMNDEISAVLPAGVLGTTAPTLALTAPTYGTPCSSTTASDHGDPSGPAFGTIQCAMASMFADPATYPGVGQDGLLESVRIFAKGYVLSLKTCSTTFTTAQQTVSLPVIGETVKLACGRTPAVAELAADFVTALPYNSSLEAATVAENEAMLTGAKISLAWGQAATGTTVTGQDVVAFMDMPAKTSLLGGGAPEEKDVWWYSKDAATDTMTLKSISAQGTMSTRRFITGNQTTHYFVFNYFNQDTSSSRFRRLRGAGYSHGAGNYYLIEVQAADYTDTSNNDASLDGTETLSFCFNAATNAQVAASHCTQFKAAAEATSNAWFTATHMPTSISDITVPSY